MGILRRKEEAKEQAANIAQDYNIKYSEDGNSYQLIHKDTGKRFVGGAKEYGGLGTEERLLTPNRRYKKLIGREVEKQVGSKDSAPSGSDTGNQGKETDKDKIAIATQLAAMNKRLDSLETPSPKIVTNTGTLSKAGVAKEVQGGENSQANPKKESGSKEILESKGKFVDGRWIVETEPETTTKVWKASEVGIPNTIPRSEVFQSGSMFGHAKTSDAQSAKAQGKAYLLHKAQVFSVEDVMKYGDRAEPIDVNYGEKGQLISSESFDVDKARDAFESGTNFYRVGDKVYDLSTVDWSKPIKDQAAGPNITTVGKGKDIPNFVEGLLATVIGTASPLGQYLTKQVLHSRGEQVITTPPIPKAEPIAPTSKVITRPGTKYFPYSSQSLVPKTDYEKSSLKNSFGGN